MIKKGETLEIEVREHMRDGAGSVELTKLFTKEELLNKSRMFNIITLKPGCGIGYHEHKEETEFFYIINGTPTYRDDDAEVELKAGDVTACPSGHGHAITNNTDEVIKLVALIILN